MNKQTPWDDISRPESDYNVRRISGSNTVPLFWARDTEGRCLFVVELEGDNTNQFGRNEISVHGISVDLRLLDGNRIQALVLTLEQHIDRDLFQGLCETLVASLQAAADSSAALGIALVHLKRWKAFMAGRRSKLLSPEEVRGLFAELQFLRFLYREHLPEKSAVDAWCGPEGVHQDFVIANTAIEIKSVSGKERSSVRISSEDQLESSCDRIFLVIFHVSEMPDSEQALSLNGLVRSIEAELTDAEAIEQLSARLAAAGYVEMRAYDKPVFLITARQNYMIESGFPRLVRSGLPEGIRNVRYEIAREEIKPYICDTSKIWEGVD